MSNDSSVASDTDLPDSHGGVETLGKGAVLLYEGVKGKQLNWVDVKAALETQSRVIQAMILRETLSRYGDHKIGFLWALLEPLLMVTLFVGLMSAMRSENPGGMPLVPFLITGIVPFFMFRNNLTQLKGSIISNRALLGFPQVTTFDVIIARCLLESGVLLMVFGVILLLAHLFGYTFRIEDPLGVLAVCITLMALGTGFGFVFAVLIPIVPSTGQISSLVLGRPLFLTSGLFFTASSVPDPYRTWLLYNPIFHLMELMRSYFFYEYETAYGSWSYAGTWAIVLVVLGLITHQALRRRAIVGL